MILADTGDISGKKFTIIDGFYREIERNSVK